MALVKIPLNASGDERTALKKQAAEVIRGRGSDKKPDAPRDLVLQSGARKVIATWTGPQNMTGVVGFRVYSPTDKILVQEIRDPNCRKTEVTAPAGTTPKIVNVFVCSISDQLRESSPIVAKGSALVEAGAPVDPMPPSGWPQSSPRATCTVRGTNLQTPYGLASNVMVKFWFDEGFPVYLMGRGGIERVKTAEWVEVDSFWKISVDGFTSFGASESMTLKTSLGHTWCSRIPDGENVDTLIGYAEMRLEKIDQPAEVLRIELEGPSHEYLVEEGVWTHNQKPYMNDYIP